MAGGSRVSAPAGFRSKISGLRSGPLPLNLKTFIISVANLQAYVARCIYFSPFAAAATSPLSSDRQHLSYSMMCLVGR